MAEEPESSEDLAKEYRRALNNTRKRTPANRVLTSLQQSESNDGLLSGVDLYGADNELVYRDITPAKKRNAWEKFLAQFVPQPIYNALQPPSSRKEWRKFWEMHLPIWHWLFYYAPKFLLGDIVAGLTIGVTHIPQGNVLQLHDC